MIRFCDKKIFDVGREMLSQAILYDFFKNNTRDVIMVTNGGETEGFITYESIAYYEAADWSRCVIGERVIAGPQMWEQAKEIFHRYPKLKYLPVYNKERELTYFCYDSFADKESYLYIGQVLQMLMRNPQLLRWEQNFSGIESVEIYDMNEFSFYLLEILRQNGIDYILHGDKWKILGYETDAMQTHMDMTVMRIYAEGTEMFLQRAAECDVTASFQFLVMLMKKEVRLLEMRMQKEWDNFFLCRLPLLGELSYMTDEEEYMTNFVGGADGRELKEPSQTEAFRKVNGLQPEIFYEKKEWERRHILDKLAEYHGDVKVVRISQGEHTVWLLGPCIVEGFGVLYDDYLSCKIDRYLKTHGIDNYGVCTVSYLFYELDILQSAIASLPIHKKDVIICMGEDIGWGKMVGEEPDLKLDALFALRQGERCFYIFPIHTNARGNERISQEISESVIMPFIRQAKDVEDGYARADGLNLTVRGSWKREAEIKKYISKLGTDYRIWEFLGDSSSVGAIVMNCNPFTLGHRYLIEESAQKVEKLIIFVVEENRSYFSFAERFHMVKEGVKDMGNVIAVPSGDFVLSYQTLPAYFRKEENRQIKVDASSDLNIFCEYIAPEFSISVRFAGEEPLDPVTAQYNQQMREIFARAGNIEFSEIPRKDWAGEVISASAVRRELEKQSWQKVKAMVPETTYKFLMKKYSKC